MNLIRIKLLKLYKRMNQSSLIQTQEKLHTMPVLLDYKDKNLTLKPLTLVEKLHLKQNRNVKRDNKKNVMRLQQKKIQMLHRWVVVHSVDLIENLKVLNLYPMKLLVSIMYLYLNLKLQIHLLLMLLRIDVKANLLLLKMQCFLKRLKNSMMLLIEL